jgi:hypothetical protein
MATDDQTPEGPANLSPEEIRRRKAEDALWLFKVMGLLVALAGVAWLGGLVSEKVRGPVTPQSICLQKELDDQLKCLADEWQSEKARGVSTTETEAVFDKVWKKIDARNTASWKKSYDEEQARCQKVRNKKVADLTVADYETLRECGISIGR